MDGRLVAGGSACARPGTGQAPPGVDAIPQRAIGATGRYDGQAIFGPVQPKDALMADAKFDSDSLPGVVSTAASDLSSLRPSLVENALTEALPLPDIMFGGAVLVAVIMFHAFWIRIITSSYLKRSKSLKSRASLWRADLLFIVTIMMLLALHLAEVVVWSAALMFGDIVENWSAAAYFAANCYTALGEPFSLPREWRIVPPIIGMSGIFAFAWTASVLVNFVSRYNDLREVMIGHREAAPES
ncbi:hypothetical protein QTH97_12730 [Variovorax sp. J22R24]|uniref:hypothetical protein n=1 Tax=Variovorax gracilis TaxID=3053502 RepID=UPI00257772C1|nr:hypothetical protein [Variovorax sp. J22R24]MDM0105804.1 hypothetical protein [Variovorax sp. J22R24]